MSYRSFKYPIVLFFALFALKIFYIVIESFYNYDVLDILTKANLTRGEIDSLNITGHQISSLGITLLLIPFFYMIIKNRRDAIVYISVMLFSIASYFSIYFILNKIVDGVVKIQQEKRHDAYYLNLFKYGILNNIFVYNSFVNSKEIQNNSLHVDSKIVLTNTFLALYADKKLINKIKERGKERIADIYISKQGKDEFEKEFEKFQDLSKKVSKYWKEYNSARKELKTELATLEKESDIKKAYQELQDRLLNRYKEYKKAYASINQKVEDETSLKKLNKIKPLLERYFKYQKYEKAQKQYREKMNSSFGHYIEPSKWLGGGDSISYYSMAKVIREEISKNVQDKIGIEIGLSPKEFFNKDIVKIKVSQMLKEYNILIPYDFNYSYSQFKRYYLVMTSKKRKGAYSVFYNKLTDEIGENDLKLDANWKEFIYSEYLYNKIAKDSGLNDKKDINTIQDILFLKNLGNFKERIYLPKVIKKVEKQMYTKDEFMTVEKVSLIGDDAIKLLYIPPMALSLSIVALLLNVITTFGMVMVLLNVRPKILAVFAKLTLAAVILFLPAISSQSEIDNKMLNRTTTEDMRNYIKFLGWISYWEKLNVKLHEKFL